MSELTKKQISFLKAQDISPAQVFDASNTKRKLDIQKKMDTLELFFYFGHGACRKAGHTLRTKAGHCIQCDTARIAYQLRSSAAGYVYLAYSRSKKIAKVGFTKNHPKNRADFLRKTQYGMASDWEIKKLAQFDNNAGRKEFAIHSKLEAYLKPVVYEKHKGHIVECREIFSCRLVTAAKAFDEVTKQRR